MFNTFRGTENIWAYVNLKWYAGRKKERYSVPNYSTIIQRAAAAALTGPQDCVVEMRQVYQHRRDLAVSLLKDLGCYVYTPHGAFYILVDVSGPDGTKPRGRQFALDLLRERNIAAAPDSTFGSVAENYVRISLAASDEEIVRGVRGICAFADSDERV
jgi:aspartate aminotransferase